MSVQAAAQQTTPRRAARWGVLLLIIAAVAATVLEQEHVRTLEARLAAAWLPTILRQPVTAAGDGFMITHTSSGAVLFKITAECTVLVLIVPIALFIAALLLHRGTTIRRVLTALLATTAALTLINQGRLALIAWATTTWGINPGYTVSHLLVGSLIGILGFAGCLVLAAAILGIRRRQH